jgi:hypothetical protein
VPNRTSRLSAKCRKNVARFSPARSAICAAVVSSYPFHPGLIEDIEQGHYFI